MAHQTGVRVQQFGNNTVGKYSYKEEKAWSQHDVRVNSERKKNTNNHTYVISSLGHSNDSMIANNFAKNYDAFSIVENYYNSKTVEQKAMFTLYKVTVKLILYNNMM